MKSYIIVPAITLALAAHGVTSLAAQETKPLDPAALSSLEQAPVTEAPRVPPKFVPKGEPRETSRAYIMKSGAGGVQSKAARVVTLNNGTKVESPLVDIPLLFQKNKTDLADAQSRANLTLLAAKLKELESTGATFSIEGHASAEGDNARNQTLSSERAAAIAAELKAAGVGTATIAKTAGFGSRHATQKANAAESLLAKDRRVLVIREK